MTVFTKLGKHLQRREVVADLMTDLCSMYEPNPSTDQKFEKVKLQEHQIYVVKTDIGSVSMHGRIFKGCVDLIEITRKQLPAQCREQSYSSTACC